ncbi:MAG: hypothetical protein ACLFV1_05205 [Thiohalophilus sp.]
MICSVRVFPVVFLIVLLGAFASGCTIRYVADYDAEVKDEILRIAKEVDRFWGKLLDTPSDQRAYARFGEDYSRIESDLRGLLMRNQIRPLNALSTKQSQIALDLWLDDRQAHRENDGMSDFIARRHRQQFARVFVAMARGETVKESPPDNQ